MQKNPSYTRMLHVLRHSHNGKRQGEAINLLGSVGRYEEGKNHFGFSPCNILQNNSEEQTLYFISEWRLFKFGQDTCE